MGPEGPSYISLTNTYKIPRQHIVDAHPQPHLKGSDYERRHITKAEERSQEGK